MDQLEPPAAADSDSDSLLRQAFPMAERDTSENLSDKILLKIFCYFLDVSPRDWPRLVHTCRKWRRVVFASQKALNLRLFCTHGTPVQKFLGCWPAALPIVVEYGGSPELDPLAPEDENNIMAALRQSGRVSSISFNFTSWFSEKLGAISKALAELEDLALLSRESALLTQTLTSAFQSGGASFRRTTHQHSFRSLVDFQLHEVFLPPLFLPQTLTNALSGMIQLQSLSLHLLLPANYVYPPPPSGKPVGLPVLTRFSFRGNTGCLESLVAGIDAPRLGRIEVTFFDGAISELLSELPKFSQFINRIKLHKSHRRADIFSSEHAISISLTQQGVPTYLKFQFFCDTLALQLSSMTQICIQFSALLFDVEDLHIIAIRRSRQEVIHHGSWLEAFAGVKCLHARGYYILRALQLPDTLGRTVLPALQKLYIPAPRPGYTPSSADLVSLITSRRLSGHHIAVEYERLSHESELRGEGGFFSQQVTIEMLYDDILLNIFRHCLDVTPQYWPTLGFVCRRWRQVVLTSPLGLNLRLYFTYGTPVLKALDCWKVLPIVVQYGGFSNLDPPAPEDDDNIIAALMQSGRVGSINLTLTSSLIERISAISEPFSELEELALLSHDNTQVTLPSSFRWGPRLRTLHSTRIEFPSFPPLLSPCHDLVDLQLHEIPRTRHFPPEVFANALSGMNHLRNLSLHFLSSSPRRNFLSFPPQPEEHVVLPALTHLKYRGTSKYLDSFVARIDAPHLVEINITLFNQPTMDTSQLGRFIGRVEMQTSVIKADVETSAHAISISFTDSNTSALFQLQISCKQLDWQLYCMAQACSQFLPFLIRVHHLNIKTTQSSSEKNDVVGEQWLELVRSFDGTRDLGVANELTTNILRALGRADGGHTTVLPALRRIRVKDPTRIMNEHALLIFVNSRLASGHPVHLADMHGYRVMCSYCADFECTPGHNDQFRKHLERDHPKLTRGDALIRTPFLMPLQLERLVNRHSSLRAPDIVALSTAAGRGTTT